MPFRWSRLGCLSIVLACAVAGCAPAQLRPLVLPKPGSARAFALDTALGTNGFSTLPLSAVDPRPLHGRDRRPRRQGLRGRLHHARRRSGVSPSPASTPRASWTRPSAPTASPPPTSPWAARPASWRGPSPSRATARSSPRARPSTTRRAAATPPAIPTSRSCASTPPGKLDHHLRHRRHREGRPRPRPRHHRNHLRRRHLLGPRRARRQQGSWSSARSSPRPAAHRRRLRPGRPDQRRRRRTRLRHATAGSWSTLATRLTARGT